ncbi:hypothetical protein C8R43DRAFT_1019024, partial [Mycena crocata]
MSSPDPSSTPLSVRIAASKPQNQLQSPLFASLYPELRNMVFRHALTEYDDPARPYSKHEYYYRPGLEFAGKIDTNLLLTCRLIYLETHLAPVSLNEHVFWMYRAPQGRYVSDPTGYLARMTHQQRAAVRRMRFYTQLYWLESRNAEEWFSGLSVSKLAITIRHSDWWHWENGEDLRVEEPSEQWGAWVGSLPGLQELELELETLDAKREQLEERVRVALEWKFPLAKGGALIHDGAEAGKSMWQASSRMTPGHQYDDYADDDIDWDDEDLDDEDLDNYYADPTEDSSEAEGSGIAGEHVEPENYESVAKASDSDALEAATNPLASELDSEVEEYLAFEDDSGEERNPVVPTTMSDPLETTTMPDPLENLDAEGRLDLKFPLDLKLHVRKLKFVHESRL